MSVEELAQEYQKLNNEECNRFQRIISLQNKGYEDKVSDLRDAIQEGKNNGFDESFDPVKFKKYLREKHVIEGA